MLQSMRREPKLHPTPTRGLLLGLAVILCTVVAYSWYIRLQITHLRQVQTELVNRNRRDSLQLLRIENDLNALALGMRDMAATDQQLALVAWRAQFARLRTDLEDALRIEDTLAPRERTAEQRRFLSSSFENLWSELDTLFATAEKQEKKARELIPPLQTHEASLSNNVARLLVENNQVEEQAAGQIEGIYVGVERQLYIFLAATLVAIIITIVLLIVSNRQVFRRLEELSEQRSDLAQKVITTQESTLQFISRELHDEFGQILTAIGALLGRAERQAPANSPWAKEVHEVREIAQRTLENVRSLSQALHPVILDEAGVESAIEWYLPTVERQHGIPIHFRKSGESRPISSRAGIHIYRVLQEAINNLVRHSQTESAEVRLQFRGRDLVLEVEDRGKGMEVDKAKRGIGMVAMRERAELIGGTIEWLPAGGGGTCVRLTVPQENLE
jgi:signal transduction histidine kinase